MGSKPKYAVFLACQIGFLMSLPLVAHAQLEVFRPCSTTGQVVKHEDYWLSYSEADEQAEWVYYVLTPARVRGTVKRKNNFRADDLVTTGSATLADYAGSGYDRGHLCAAADNTHSPEAMAASFLMGNMSPQEPGFNRGVWKRLENLFRQWTTTRDSIYVVTGGVLTVVKDTIGTNGVTVPAGYYKIALHVATDTTAIAFLLPNASSKAPLTDFLVSIDSVEALTGIDFFYLLPNQETFEAGINATAWWPVGDK